MSSGDVFNWSRRALLGAGGAMIAGRALALVPTPRQTEGPFYPDPRLIRAADADLTRLPGGIQALGEVIDLSGRVVAADGSSAAGVAVEIWQADHQGHYRHPRDGNRADPAFEGFGTVTTDADGRYAFRTIRPAPYGSRTPHIHAKVRKDARAILTTQMYFPGEALNDRDGIFRALGDGAGAATAALTTANSPFGSGARAVYDWTIVLV